MPASHEALVKSTGLIDADKHEVVVEFIISHTVRVETVLTRQDHAVIGAFPHREINSWINSQGSVPTPCAIVDVVGLDRPVRRVNVRHHLKVV
jgi:hypothetical protein